MDYREAFITGLLFKQHPEMFATAICDLIENGSYREAVQVFQQITPENASSAIVEALSRRAHRVNQPFQAESDALWTLRRVAPQRFVSEFTFEVAANWHASAREAVVVAYKDLEAHDVSGSLASFLADPVFAVRRAAARILAKVNARRLDTETRRLVQSEELHLRLSGVEAAACLTDDEGFQSILQQGRQDREGSVRSVAEEALRERRRAHLAQEYLCYVLNTPADQLTTTWQYGQALQQVGDDETLEGLDEAIDEPDCLPNRCAYLEHLREEVKKGWEKWRDKRKDRLEE